MFVSKEMTATTDGIRCQIFTLLVKGIISSEVKNRALKKSIKR